ncbi:acetyl transferase [Ophiostoma piceae UAMH 11346]|uniref:Acetyl transferase n=1 Tax=Ophiostoma piceae (strain UAMH 11346) TaxID=1262450 RepID=S3C1I2_OPHP1|nr:acetyl transferase [Ophiostoma piceae UAMH 11346]
MAHIVRGARRWTQKQMQPLYDQLPMSEEHGDEKEHSLASPSSSSSSSSSASSLGTDSRRNNDSPRSSSSNRAVYYVYEACSMLAMAATLLVRFPYLCFLLATAPLRRRRLFSTSNWPETYESLEEFKVLVPSFLQPVDPKAVKRPMHPTAWLDGLRGVAAFFVVWHHASLLWFSWHIHYGYGTAKEDNGGPGGEKLLFQWPFVRLMIAGMPHVAVFFVISGYALSYKPLKLSRQGRFAEASEAINSSVFRRHTRLFLMPAVTTFVIAVLGYLDMFGTKNWAGVAVAQRRPPHPDAGLWAQLVHWMWDFLKLVDPINKGLSRGNRFAYDYNLWTLPIEFDCSLMLFLCQAAFNRMRPRVRMLYMFGIATFAMSYIYWQAFLFLAGMLLCDIHFELDAMAAKSAAEPQSEKTTAAKSLSSFIKRHATAIGIVCFVACIYVLSMPESARGAASTPGYVTLFKWAPKYHRDKNGVDYWYLPLAAAFLVLTVDRTPLLQTLFTNAFAQYLGKISYSMYLVHGGVIWTIGHWTIRKAVMLVGRDTQVQYGIAVGIAAVVTWSVTVFLSDLATRTIDARAVSFGRVLYEKCCQPETKADVLPRTQ